MIQQLLDRLADRPEEHVFLGADRITREEFADLVWRYAGGLRKRGARSVVMLAPPGPASLAFLLAALGTGTRLDFVPREGGTDLVRARLESAGSDFVVAGAGLRFALKGPHWIRSPLGLPHYTLWPEIVGIDDIGAAQQRRFGVADEQAAALLFTGGTVSAPAGVVHTVGSLSAVLTQLVGLADGAAGAPAVADGFGGMLAALALGQPIVRPARPARLARQLARLAPANVFLHRHRWPAGAAAGDFRAISFGPATPELVTRLRGLGAGRLWALFGTAEAPLIAADDGSGHPDSVGRLLDGVSARLADGQLWVSGDGVAPRLVDGEWVGEQATGDLVSLSGDEVRLTGSRTGRILSRGRFWYPELYEPTLAPDGGVALVGVSAACDERLVALVADAGDVRRVARAARRIGLPLQGVVVGEIPLCGTGIDRAAARALAARLLG